MTGSSIGLFYDLLDNSAKVLANSKSHKNIKVEGNQKLSEYYEWFAKNRIFPLYNQEKNIDKKPYIVAMVGLTNAGKSTILEALLGCEILPRDTGPTTAIPIIFEYDNNGWSIEITNKSAIKAPKRVFSDEIALKKDLEKLAVNSMDGASKLIAKVKVKGKIEILKDGLVMADTPGFGAAQIGEEENTHQEAFEKFMSKVDRMYYCVCGIDKNIREQESEIFKRYSSKCDHVIINKWQGNDKAKNRYKSTYQHLFPSAQFVFIDCTKIDEKSIKEADLSALKEIIALHSTANKRRELFNREFIIIWDELNDHLLEHFELKKILWSSLSYEMFKASCLKEPNLKNIKFDNNWEAL